MHRRICFALSNYFFKHRCMRIRVLKISTKAENIKRKNKINQNIRSAEDTLTD
jgi:hypothetical protein